MRRFGSALMLVLALLLTPVTFAAQTWTEGTNFEVISPAQPTHVAHGKVEVMEVFSFGCPACNHFQPIIGALQRSLPANAQMVFLPASFIPAEDWVVFQRAYFTADALKIENPTTHQQIYDAIWETGDLQTLDPTTHRLKSPLPTIEDVARVYEHLAGVKADVFLATARSPAIDAKMKAADAQLVAMHVASTPTIVVNGKYRVLIESLQSVDDLTSLVQFLVARETNH